MDFSKLCLPRFESIFKRFIRSLSACYDSFDLFKKWDKYKNVIFVPLFNVTHYLKTIHGSGFLINSEKPIEQIFSK